MLECKDVVKIYGAGRTKVLALRGINLQVNAGELIGIKGPSGSGKTTLLNILGTIDMPSSGSVVFNDIYLEEMTPKEIMDFRRHQVGVVFQFFNLVSNLTAQENVELPMAISGIGASDRQRRAVELLDEVGVKHLARRYPNELSGGEMQRTAIAVALANDPPLILADEPTGELDHENTELVMDLFTKLNKEHKKTVIIASHNEYLISRMKRVIELRDGAVFRTTDSSLIKG